MNVLVACECSGRVKTAFRLRGHNAWSCDLKPSEIPDDKYHIQGDVREILSGFIADPDIFIHQKSLQRWDLLIAHPTCTYLCRHRSRWNDRSGTVEEQIKAREFFMMFLAAPIEKICVENPVPLKALKMPPYSQIIQPWQFGHDYSKKTCLWLRNLPHLKPTNIVDLTYITTQNGYRYTAGWYKTPRTSEARSRTFQGIANAMAEQWG